MRGFNGAVGFRLRILAANSCLVFTGVNLELCFNGAVGFRLRIRDGAGGGRLGDAGLQWGRRLSPTDTLRVSAVGADTGRLQWGRRLSPTDTAEIRAKGGGFVWASMGP